MQKLLALSIIYILLICEWQNTIKLLASAETCCITVCCEEENDCSDEQREMCIVKSCYCCCYLMPAGINMSLIADETEKVFVYKDDKAASLVSDFFHPPEYI